MKASINYIFLFNKKRVINVLNILRVKRLFKVFVRYILYSLLITLKETTLFSSRKKNYRRLYYLVL